MANIDDLIKRHEKRLSAESRGDASEYDARTRLAAQFAEARIRSGMSQRELADISGIAQAEISRIETASSNPTLATLDALGSALGKTLELTS